jgi:quercetin dioxygenase-like cupin family protein
MELKSTLKVYNESELPSSSGSVAGQSTKILLGNTGHPSERIWVLLANFKAGAAAKPHWHLIEGFYYVISGRATATDIEGRTYEMRPGSIIYAPPGIAGTHSWDVKEDLRIIAIRATTDSEKNLTFNVDMSTKQSSIDLNSLERFDATKFKKSVY